MGFPSIEWAISYATFFFCFVHHFNSSGYYYYNSMLKCQTNHTASRKSETPQNWMNKIASLSFIDLNFRYSIKGDSSVIIIQLKCHWNQFFSFLPILFSFIFYLFQPKKKVFPVERVTTSKADSVKSAWKRLMIPIYQMKTKIITRTIFIAYTTTLTHREKGRKNVMGMLKENFNLKCETNV